MINSKIYKYLPEEYDFAIVDFLSTRDRFEAGHSPGEGIFAVVGFLYVRDRFEYDIFF